MTAGQYIVPNIRDTKALDVCMFLWTALSEHSFFWIFRRNSIVYEYKPVVYALERAMKFLKV